MNRYFPIVLSLLLLSFVSCASVELKQEEIVIFKQGEIDPWLISISGNKPAEINVEGKWHDPESLTMLCHMHR